MRKNSRGQILAPKLRALALRKQPKTLDMWGLVWTTCYSFGLPIMQAMVQSIDLISDSHLFMFSHGYAGFSYPFIAHSRSWTPISAREARHPPSPTKFLSLKAIRSLRPSSLCQPFRHLLARSTIVTQREVQRACARVSIQLLGPVT